MADFPLTLTAPKADSSDFTEWLGPNSRLPSDIEFEVQSVTSEGKVLYESIPAHKAIVANAIPALDEVLFDKKRSIQVLQVKATGGDDGIKAFKLFLFCIYGRKIKMKQIECFNILANLAGFARLYSIEDIRAAAVTRMNELVEYETDYEVLSKLSALAGNAGLESLKASTTAKIQAVVIKELDTNVLAKLNGLEIVEEKDKLRILHDLADLASKHKVASLRSAVAARMEAVVVTETNFSSLVGIADSTELMQPLRKALSSYIRANYGYTEELSYFLESQHHLELRNLFPILAQVHQKGKEE